MKKTLTAIAIILALASCQKELSFDDPTSVPGSGNTGGGSTGGGPTTTGLLVRNVEVSGSDSTVSVYSYNSANRLTGIVISGGGFDLTYAIKRSASNVITQTVIKSPAFAAQGIDSLATNFFYNNATSRYTYSIYSLTISGITIADSTVFVYDASGNITSSISYTKIPFTGYTPTAKIDNVYTGGNITSQKTYDYDDASQSWKLDETLTITYDAKVNALQIGVEAIIIASPTLFGPNNSLTQTYVDANNPSNNYSRSNTFTYNTANKPSGGTSVLNPGGSSNPLRFYYN